MKIEAGRTAQWGRASPCGGLPARLRGRRSPREGPAKFGREGARVRKAVTGTSVHAQKTLGTEEPATVFRDRQCSTSKGLQRSRPIFNGVPMALRAADSDESRRAVAATRSGPGMPGPYRMRVVGATHASPERSGLALIASHRGQNQANTPKLAWRRPRVPSTIGSRTPAVLTGPSP